MCALSPSYAIPCHLTSQHLHLPIPLTVKSTHFTYHPEKKRTTMEGKAVSPAKLRADFLRVLRSRRSCEAPLVVKQAQPVTNPMYQQDPSPKSIEAMEACPRANIDKNLLVEENLYLYTEESEQGQVPILILSMKQSVGHESKRPAVVILHSTHMVKEFLRPLLEAYASRGYVAIGIDSRYHGERAANRTAYQQALVSSWKNGDTMPFIFDTVWDLIKLADYLTTQRKDIDSARIGITGESLGGMHALYAAFADTRYAVAAPIIGTQGFRWAIDNDRWQARIDSLKAVFEAACVDMGKSAIDKEVVEKVWDRIAPGLAGEFDAPYSVPAIAPRPLLILNGADDPRNPLPGLDVPRQRAQQAYEAHHHSDYFKFVAEPGIPHQMTPFMVIQASEWFDRSLMSKHCGV